MYKLMDNSMCISFCRYKFTSCYYKLQIVYFLQYQFNHTTTGYQWSLYIQQFISISDLILTSYILSWYVASTSTIIPLSHIFLTLSQPFIHLFRVQHRRITHNYREPCQEINSQSITDQVDQQMLNHFYFESRQFCWLFSMSSVVYQ